MTKLNTNPEYFQKEKKILKIYIRILYNDTSKFPIYV